MYYVYIYIIIYIYKIMADSQQKPTQHCKAIILQLQIQFKKK